MERHEDTVAGGVNVGLQVVEAEVNGVAEGLNGVLNAQVGGQK